MYPSWFSPVATSCKIIVQEFNKIVTLIQSIDYIQVSKFLIYEFCVCMCLCVSVHVFTSCNFIIWMYPCIHRQSKGTKQEFHSHKDPSCCPFSHTHFSSVPLTSSLIKGNPDYFLPNFISSRVLYKWNHTGCNLSGWAFSFSVTCMVIYLSCYF